MQVGWLYAVTYLLLESCVCPVVLPLARVTLHLSLAIRAFCLEEVCQSVGCLVFVCVVARFVLV